MKLAPAEREYLQSRIARGILWANALAHERDNANRLARTCIEAIEGAATEASTVKRAVIKISERMERTG